MNTAEELMAVLDQIASTPIKESTQITETVGDDFPLSEEQTKRIQFTEAIVQEVLSLFDINYDDLIRMDGKSPYAVAVQANPNVLEMVKNAPNPALAALKVAMQVKPYADFMKQYGSTPEEIKQALKNEFENEANVKRQVLQENASKEALADASPFSITQRQSGSKSVKKSADLNQLFGG